MRKSSMETFAQSKKRKVEQEQKKAKCLLAQKLLPT